MRYLEIKILTTQEGIDPLTCILLDMGIAGFAVEDAGAYQELMNKKNSYDWDYIDESLLRLDNLQTGITLYLEETEEGQRLLKLLREKLNRLKDEGFPAADPGNTCMDPGSLELSVRSVDDSAWKDNWKEYFKPAKITERIVIKPTWEKYDKEGDELVIELDPGMAFGTGTHPTTALCVKLLERYLEPHQDTVLDVGCGSGILAIASALLGAKAVLAVDIDPAAVKITKENTELNHLSSKIRVKEGDLTKGLSERTDIVAANLMADLVILLTKDVAAHLKGKSIYISSGILIEKKTEVADAIEEFGFQILDIVEEGEWCAIAAALPGRCIIPTCNN